MRATLKRLSRAAFGLIALCFVLTLSHALWAQQENKTAAHSTGTVAPDTLGTATGTTVACSGIGIAGGSCYSVALTCPNVTSTTASVKVLSPTSTPIGTVVMTAGGGDASYYEFAPGYGNYIVNNVVAAGFTPPPVHEVAS